MSKDTNILKKENLQEDEINLIELSKIIWLKKWLVLKITIIFSVFGLIIAITSPVEYKSRSLLIPENTNIGSNIGSSIGGLASLAGVNLNDFGSNDGINPGLYRSVAQSTPFLLKLMEQEFYFERIEKKISLFEYHFSSREVSLVEGLMSIPSKIRFLLRNEDLEVKQKLNEGILNVSKKQQVVATDLLNRILVTMDWDLNIVEVEAQMQDPIVSAEVVKFVQDYITNYVIEYSVLKSKEQLSFVESQLEQKRIDFEQVQNQLATFRDQNQFVNSARARTEEEILQSRYSLAFNIYNQLAKQVETIKLQLTAETPVFSILEPPRVPVKKAYPKRILIVLGSMFFGVAASLLIIYTKFILN